MLMPRNVFRALIVSSFYRGVQALATLSKFLKMWYFGRCIIPVLDITKTYGSPAIFLLTILGTRIFKLLSGVIRWFKVSCVQYS
jgi:hypothetical protein